jgi:hypothetical protein
MKVEQIKEAVSEGKQVVWHHEGYQVIKDSLDQYLIKCTMNNSYIGLTHKDGSTLNGQENEFFII